MDPDCSHLLKNQILMLEHILSFGYPLGWMGSEAQPPTIHHQWISSLLDKCIFGNNSSNPIQLRWEIPHVPKWINLSNAKPEFPWVFNVATHLSGKGTWTIHWNRLVFPCPSCRYINKATYDAVDQSGRILIKMCLGPMKHMTHMTHVMAWIGNLLIWNVLESEYPWSGLVWK